MYQSLLSSVATFRSVQTNHSQDRGRPPKYKHQRSHQNNTFVSVKFFKAMSNGKIIAQTTMIYSNNNNNTTNTTSSSSTTISFGTNSVRYYCPSRPARRGVSWADDEYNNGDLVEAKLLEISKDERPAKQVCYRQMASSVNTTNTKKRRQEDQECVDASPKKLIRIEDPSSVKATHNEDIKKGPLKMKTSRRSLRLRHHLPQQQQPSPLSIIRCPSEPILFPHTPFARSQKR